LPRDRDVVLYCNCPNEVSAAIGARALRDAGVGRAWPLAGGLEGWAAEGRPLARADWQDAPAQTRWRDAPEGGSPEVAVRRVDRTG
jgi:3-mercaptopyruvate sulfurtransferase SseA